MSKPIKERIADNLDKVKGEGKLRSENIRELLADAASLTFSELKEGSQQMRTILKEAIATIATDIKDTSSEIPEKVTHSIEGAIEDSTRYSQEAIASLQAKIHEIQHQIDERQREIDMDVQDTIVDIKATEIDESSQLNSAIDKAASNVKERKESELLKQQYLNLKFQLANLDTKLSARYADVKHQLDNIKTIYDRAKVEAEASGVTPVQAKQTEIERKLSKFASAVAITEHEIKQYLQELWKNKGFDSHPKP
jgi:ribosomal protein L29